MNKILIALMTLSSPVHAEGLAKSTIESGVFSKTDPPLTITYAQSEDNPVEFALSVTTAEDPIKASNGLPLSTAIFANCSFGTYTASFGYLSKDPREAAETIAHDFCIKHERYFSHKLFRPF